MDNNTFLALIEGLTSVGLTIFSASIFLQRQDVRIKSKNGAPFISPLQYSLSLGYFVWWTILFNLLIYPSLLAIIEIP